MDPTNPAAKAAADAPPQPRPEVTHPAPRIIKVAPDPLSDRQRIELLEKFLGGGFTPDAMNDLHARLENLEKIVTGHAGEKGITRLDEIEADLGRIEGLELEEKVGGRLEKLEGAFEQLSGLVERFASALEELAKKQPGQPAPNEDPPTPVPTPPGPTPGADRGEAAQGQAAAGADAPNA